MSCENPIHHYGSLLTRNFLLCFINFSLSLCGFWGRKNLRDLRCCNFQAAGAFQISHPLATAFSGSRASQLVPALMLSSWGSQQDRQVTHLATSYVPCSSLCLQTGKLVLKHCFQCSLFQHSATFSHKTTPDLVLNLIKLKTFRWREWVSSTVHFNRSCFSVCMFCTRGWSPQNCHYRQSNQNFTLSF